MAAGIDHQDRFGTRRLKMATRTIACALFLAAGVSANGANAQATAKIEAQESAEGYGRIVLTFEDKLPEYKVSTSTGVVVVAIGEPAAPDMSTIPGSMASFVAAARRDPDGRAIRIALAQPVSVNTMEAGEKLFIDLLPQDWVGMPPGLPAAVVAELARRAEEAEEKRRQQEILDRFLKSKPVEVRITSLPTFTRFVFVWDGVPDATVERSIETAQINFDRPARIDLSGIKSRLPAYISNITSRLGETGLEIFMTVDPEAPVRGFREELTYVVDVTAPVSADADMSSLGDLALDQDGAATLMLDNRPADEPDPVVQASATAVPKNLADTEAESLPREAEEIAERPDDPMAAPASASEEMAGDSDSNEIPLVRPEARRFGDSVRLTLPFLAPTPAAVFERGGALWAVFETEQQIDTRLLKDNLRGSVSDVESWRSGSVTLLRLRLLNPGLASVAGQATSWIITIGDVKLEPTEPISFNREIGPDGLIRAAAKFTTANAIHEIIDHDSGEHLFVVTAMGPGRAIPKPYNFVEFSAPQTIHSLVVRPIVDDLDVTYDGTMVRVRRDKGLSLSQVSGTYMAGHNEPFDAARPGFVDTFEDGALDPGSVYRLLAQHVSEAAEASDGKRTRARLQMARSLLATELGAEALAQLNLVEQDDPGALRDPSVRALRGIANVMMGRPDEAVRDFDAFGLNQSTDIALWRGLAELDLGNWRAAQAALNNGEPAIASYSKARQRTFRLAAAKAALEMNDIATAAVRLAELTETAADDDMDLKLLNARLAASLGQKELALVGYDDVIAANDRRLSAEAQLRRVAVLRSMENGKPVDDESIETLERLAISWRGDEVELGALRLLAGLYVDRSDYYRAFEVMKSATVADSQSPTTRALQDDMNAAFEELYLGGGADELPAIEALSLYYDFRELTPIGRKGDEIIRGLADRLVEVDLLGQASELLRHQVDHRLKGAARAQVAAKLAWLYLMNRKPTDAITVLARTRQAVLPREVSYQRLLLEARALSETGRTDLALDLLSSSSGPEVDTLRADVLWKGRRWQDAGEAIERGLNATWADPDMMAADKRAMVLRGAISFALADDKLGLQRYRAKFLAKMANSPDARAFDVVTLPVPDNAGEFNDLVTRVAAVDTIDAFLNEYRERYVLTPPPGAAAAPEAATPQS